jgi:hypothetical protein
VHPDSISCSKFSSSHAVRDARWPWRRRTNVLQGIVHLLLFFVYLALIVSP